MHEEYLYSSRKWKRSNESHQKNKEDYYLGKEDKVKKGEIQYENKKLMILDAQNDQCDWKELFNSSLKGDDNISIIFYQESVEISKEFMAMIEIQEA